MMMSVQPLWPARSAPSGTCRARRSRSARRTVDTVPLDVCLHAQGGVSAVLAHAPVEVDGCAEVQLAVGPARDDVDDVRAPRRRRCSRLAASGGGALAALPPLAPLGPLPCRRVVRGLQGVRATLAVSDLLLAELLLGLLLVVAAVDADGALGGAQPAGRRPRPVAVARRSRRRPAAGTYRSWAASLRLRLTMVAKGMSKLKCRSKIG